MIASIKDALAAFFATIVACTALHALAWGLHYLATTSGAWTELNLFPGSGLFVLIFFTPIVIPGYFHAGVWAEKFLLLPHALCTTPSKQSEKPSIASGVFLLLAMALTLAGFIYSCIQLWNIEKLMYTMVKGISGWATMALILAEFVAYWYGCFIGFIETLSEFSPETGEAG